MKELCVKTYQRNVYWQNNYSPKYKTTHCVMKFMMPYSSEHAANLSLLAKLFEEGSANISSRSQVENILAELYGTNIGFYVKRIGNILEFTIESTAIKDTMMQRLKIDLTALNALGLTIPQSHDANFNDIWFMFILELLLNQKFYDEHDMTISNKFATRLAVHKRQLIDTLSRIKEDNMRLVVLQTLKQIYADQPEALATSVGTLELIDSVTLKSIQRSYERLFDESQVFILTHGEMEDTVVLSAIKKIASRISTKPLNLPYEHNVIQRLPMPIFNSEAVVSAQQSQLMIVYDYGQIHTIRDTIILQLSNLLFGESTTSALFMEIREELNLCYYIQSSLNINRQLVFVQMGIHHEQREAAQLAVSEVLTMLRCLTSDADAYQDWVLELENQKLMLLAQDLQNRDNPFDEIEYDLIQHIIPTHALEHDTLRDVLSTITFQDIQMCWNRFEYIGTHILKGMVTSCNIDTLQK